MLPAKYDWAPSADFLWLRLVFHRLNVSLCLWFLVCSFGNIHTINTRNTTDSNLLVSLFHCFCVSLFACFFVCLLLRFFVSLRLCFSVSLFLCYFVSLCRCFVDSLLVHVVVLILVLVVIVYASCTTPVGTIGWNVCD